MAGHENDSGPQRDAEPLNRARVGGTVGADLAPATIKLDSGATRALLLTLGAMSVAGGLPLIVLPAISRRPDLASFLFVAAAVGIVILARPQWLVPGFIAFTWTSIGASYFGGVSPVELGGLALLAAAAVNALTRREVARDALVVMALLGLPLLAASLLSTEQPALPVNRLRDLTFIFLTALTVRGRAGMERTVAMLAAIGIFLGLGAVHSVLVHPTALFPLQVGTSDLGAPRAAGPFQESNFYALSMAALLPFALYVAARGGAWRALGLASALSVLAGVLATGSRGGLVAAITGVILFALWARQRRLLWTALAVILLAAVVLLPLFSTQVESSTQRSVSGRATENRIAVAMFADHPLTGVGPGEYLNLYRDYARRIGNDDRPVRASHSLVLESAAEQGLVGLAGLLAVALALITAVRRRGAHRTMIGRALLSALLIYAIGSVFLHGSQLRLPYILIGLVLALNASVDPGGETTPGRQRTHE
jgi:O-antigen ligase